MTHDEKQKAAARAVAVVILLAEELTDPSRGVMWTPMRGGGSQRSVVLSDALRQECFAVAQLFSEVRRAEKGGAA